MTTPHDQSTQGLATVVDYIFITSFLWGFEIYDMYGTKHKLNGLHESGSEMTKMNVARNLILSVPKEGDVTKLYQEMLTSYRSLLALTSASAFNYIVCADILSPSRGTGRRRQRKVSGRLQSGGLLLDGKQPCTFEWEMVASKMLWMVSSEMWKEERRSSVNLLRFCIKSFTFTSEEYTKGKEIL